MQMGMGRQGSQMSSLGNPLGPNHPASSEASAGLRQTGPSLGMQLPTGSVITNPPIHPLTHHPSQLQAQPLGGHFQQQLPTSRGYHIQSFTQALADASQPLTAPSMHSMAAQGSSQGFSQPQGFLQSQGVPQSQGFSQSQGFFQQPLSAQGQGLTSQGFSQSQQGQGLPLQPHAAQGFFSQPQASQRFFTQGQNAAVRPGQVNSTQPQAGQTHGSSSVHGPGHFNLPNGVAHGQSLPDGSAHLPSTLPGTLIFAHAVSGSTY